MPHSVLCYTAVLINHYTYPLTAQLRPRQQYVGPTLNLKNSLPHFAHPLILQGGGVKFPKLGLDFRPSPIGVAIVKAKTNSLSIDDWPGLSKFGTVRTIPL